MRFMLSLPAPVQVLEDAAPTPELFEAMTRYNESMSKAGILLAAEGLHPTSRGARVRVSAGKRIVTDGPFTEAKEVIAGFWMIQVKSKAEAIEWAGRCPLPEGGVIEVRPIFEASDFAPEIQAKVRAR